MFLVGELTDVGAEHDVAPHEVKRQIIVPVNCIRNVLRRAAVGRRRPAPGIIRRSAVSVNRA